jgi:4-hydroxy-2-oxoheptanedioate aldolase
MYGALRSEGPVHGFWLTTVEARVVELAGSLRPDFVCIDTQHGVSSSKLSIDTFSLLAVQDVPGLVRVARNDPMEIGEALDHGAAGVIVPMVDSVEEAEEAVSAIRYTPEGVRSIGMRTIRVDPLSEDYRPICAVQIETRGGVDNAAEIAMVDGVDWLYIGPADLGLAYGGVPAPDVTKVFDGSHPLADELGGAFEAVVKAAKSHGKLPGLHTGSGEATLVAEDHGFLVSAVATDVVEMGHGLADQLKIARDLGPEPSPL